MAAPITVTELIQDPQHLAAWTALRDVLAGFPRTTAQRGRRYYDNDHVSQVGFDKNRITADVLGSDRVYTTQWLFDDGIWYSDCSCPVGFDCKHAYALALELLDCIPYLHEVPHEVGSSRSRHGQQHRTAPARHSGFKSEEDAVHALRNSRLTTARAEALEYLVDGGPLASPHLRFEWRNELEEQDPDLRCHLLACRVAIAANGWIPSSLESYLHRTDLREAVIERQRSELAHDLVAWADKEPKPSKRSIRLVLGFDVLYDGRLILTCTPRQTSPRLDDAPRTIDQIRPILAEMEAGEVAYDAAQYQALSWLVYGAAMTHQTEAQVNAAMLRTIDRFAGSPALTWTQDLDDESAAQLGIDPGGTISPSPGPARLVPICDSVDGRAVLSLRFRWDDGTERTMDECLRVHGQSHNYGSYNPFVIANGAISPLSDEPPESLIAQFSEVGSVELDADMRVSLLQSLGKRHPHLLETLDAHTKKHPVTPVIALDLREDDWLQVRLFAVREGCGWKPGEPLEEDSVFELDPRRGWCRGGAVGPTGCEAIDPDDGEAATEPRESERHTPAGEDLWQERPEPAAVRPCEEWLDTLGAGSGSKRPRVGGACPWEDFQVGWWLFLGRSGATRFADAWSTKPDGVPFFGTDAVRRLLSRRNRAVASLKVSSSGLDWFEVQADWKAEGLQLTERDVATLRAAKTEFVRLPSGWVHREATSDFDEVSTLMADLGVEISGEASRVGLFELAGAQPGTLEALEALGGDRETLEAIRALRLRIEEFDGIPRVRKPRRFRGQLRPYQRDGLDFLAYATGLGLGAILADDMGLGKTIQTLAWLQAERDRDPDGGPTLVVCPASVTENWSREAAQFTPALKVVTLDRGSDRRSLLDRIADYDLAITNYALLRRDIEQWREHRLRALVLDEAQNVKNPDAATTRAVQAIDATHRLALTGTPLENRLLDLWSIVQSVNPGYLGSRRNFSERYDRLDLPRHRRTLLAAKLRPILIRRTKAEVAPDLPDRIEESRHCEMTSGQRRLYLAELVKSRRLVEKLSEDAAALRKNRISILAALTRLRQICCHPALVGGKKDLGSGKFDAVFDLLEPLLSEGHKVLLFSQFVQSLRLLRTELKKRGIPDHMLTGNTTKRGNVVEAFQNDPNACVFLISLKAGGTGLNLTSAGYVILFDPWWNPAVEAQAIDRTHRIGQDRTVIAYRLITNGTIEEKIRELQQQKQGLANDVLSEAGFARSLNRADLDYILDDPSDGER